jgi:predicted metal-dependent hydrolase
MIEYQVEKSMRKTMTLSYKKGNFIVKAPFFITKSVIENFIKKNTAWITKQQERKAESLIDTKKILEYKSRAREYIIPRTYELAEKFGFTFEKIKITSAVTRWGSCTSKRNINFSYRLVLTRKEAIDYVIIHELCHLRQMNHSKKFWSEVENIMPDYKVWEKWLKDNASKYH